MECVERDPGGVYGITDVPERVIFWPPDRWLSARIRADEMVGWAVRSPSAFVSVVSV